MNNDDVGNYNVSVRKIDDKYFLTITELVLSVSGEDLTEVYQNLETKKNEALQSMRDSGMDDRIPLPNSSSDAVASKGQLGFRDEIVSFTSKLAIIGIIILLAGGLFYQLGKPMIQNLTLKLKMIPHEMTKIPQEKITNAAKTTKELMKKFSPILNEIKPLYDSEPPNRKK